MKRARLALKTDVPPGTHLVGVYPLEIFRIDALLLSKKEGLFLSHSGRRVPFEGQLIEISSGDRTLCFGNFFAFDVRNETPGTLPFEIVAEGISAGDSPVVQAQIETGFFVQEVQEP